MSPGVHAPPIVPPLPPLPLVWPPVPSKTRATGEQAVPDHIAGSASAPTTRPIRSIVCRITAAGSHNSAASETSVCRRRREALDIGVPPR